MKIKLRSKPITNGRLSLYLDIYPPIFNPISGKKSRREFLNLYTYAEPKTSEEKEHNKNALLEANNVLQSKVLLLEKGKYEFSSEKEILVSFEDVEHKNKNKDFLIELLQQVRNIENQILDYFKQ